MTDEDCERLGLPKGSRWLDTDDSRIISHPLLHPAQCPPHLLDPVTPPHASLSERRDYLVDASLAPPRVVEDINFMVPLIPPSVMPVNERLRHNLDLENRFSPSQQFQATPRAESGQPFSSPPVYTGGDQPPDDVCGIGMLVCHDAHGNCIVQELLRGGPAHATGKIKQNDLILSVNGVSLTGLSLDQISSLCRGPVGTPVFIDLEQDTRLHTVHMMRARRLQKPTNPIKGLQQNEEQHRLGGGGAGHHHYNDMVEFQDQSGRILMVPRYFAIGSGGVLVDPLAIQAAGTSILSPSNSVSQMQTALLEEAMDKLELQVESVFEAQEISETSKDACSLKQDMGAPKEAAALRIMELEEQVRALRQLAHERDKAYYMAMQRGAKAKDTDLRVKHTELDGLFDGVFKRYQEKMMVLAANAVWDKVLSDDDDKVLADDAFGTAKNAELERNQILAAWTQTMANEEKQKLRSAKVLQTSPVTRTGHGHNSHMTDISDLV